MRLTLKITYNIWLIFGLSLLNLGFVLAQTSSTDSTVEVENTKLPTTGDFIFRPKLSLGIGMFTFYGDVSSNHKNYHPTVSRLAYDLKLVNPLTHYLDLNFYVLFGQVSANERTLNRNLNFNSHITTGGLTFTYNFRNFTDFPKTNVNPFISFGIESVEFLSKSDLRDANGEYYYYWADGRIMNMSETDPNVANAKEIYRDYTYESDLRELDIDGYGKYQERSLAFPFVIGANFKLGERVDFQISTAMHFTRTDLIDNVTAESIGNRAGTKGMDKFLYTSASMTYDLTWGKLKADDVLDEDYWFDLYRQDTTDYDGDGVPDMADLCAKTPKDWRPVDEFGCPLDIDKDGVPDNKDNELPSDENALVDTVGVTLTEDDLYLMYRIYKDSIGEFSDMSIVSKTSSSEGPTEPKFTNVPRPEKQYVVVIGSDSIGVNHEDLQKMMSDKTFKVIEDGNKTIYVVGGSNNAQDAVNKKEQLKGQGIIGDVATIEKDENGKDILTKVNTNELPEATVSASGDFGNTQAVYKVQIGAFTKKLSPSVFADIEDLDYVKGADGLWRYYAGTFSNKEDAAKQRVDILEKGYEGAFIVAYKDGKRIKLSQAGYEIVNSNFKDTTAELSTPTVGAINPEFIKFKVQVGAFQNKIPTEILDLFLSIGTVIPQKDPVSGLTKYYFGNFKTIEEANAAKEQLKSKGLSDAFVVADFNGKIIPAQDALKLIK